MPVYIITHGTTYRYTSTVARSHQVLHLEPLATDTQECLGFELEVLPRPMDITVREDYFGNRVHYVTITEPHLELRINARSQVAVTPAPLVATTMSCGEARAWMRTSVEPLAHAARQFRYVSPATPALPQVREWTQRVFPDQRPLLDGVSQLCDEIHRQYIFDPTATHPGTPLEEFLRMQRGVCQDFAHLAIAVLRAAGLAGRYVSGYLLTHPPPGQPRQIGADASHAWVSVYVPGAGWLDFDPTNNAFRGSEHITTAHGRDYGDVSPVRGTVIGGGPQSLFLGVTVVPAGEPTG